MESLAVAKYIVSRTVSSTPHHKLFVQHIHSSLMSSSQPSIDPGNLRGTPDEVAARVAAALGEHSPANSKITVQITQTTQVADAPPGSEEFVQSSVSTPGPAPPGAYRDEYEGDAPQTDVHGVIESMRQHLPSKGDVENVLHNASDTLRNQVPDSLKSYFRERHQCSLNYITYVFIAKPQSTTSSNRGFLQERSTGEAVQDVVQGSVQSANDTVKQNMPGDTSSTNSKWLPRFDHNR